VLKGPLPVFGDMLRDAFGFRGANCPPALSAASASSSSSGSAPLSPFNSFILLRSRRRLSSKATAFFSLSCLSLITDDMAAAAPKKLGWFVLM
jgi:hypothetical protein